MLQAVMKELCLLEKPPSKSFISVRQVRPGRWTESSRGQQSRSMWTTDGNFGPSVKAWLGFDEQQSFSLVASGPISSPIRVNADDANDATAML